MHPTTRIVAARVVPLTAILVAVTAAGCRPGRPTTPAGMTLTAAAPPPPLATLVWVGRGQAERLEAGRWQRVPAFDYEFSVEQRRYADHWDSVKTLRRRHPDYDGSAGPRVQVYLFRLALTAAPGGGVSYRIDSTLGGGRGSGDAGFREAQLELAADVSRFAPFDRYRIVQHYDYPAGRLREDVELADGDRPWVRNHEEARLFGAPVEAPPPPPPAARAAGTLAR